MDDIAFSDWPGPPVDITSSNPWLPAYGCQPPATLLDKEDFIGNPDAALFLPGNKGAQYVFLETIIEETSDDLRSDSDRSGSRASPVGWLATDSESGSVIRIGIDVSEHQDSDSELEMVCPAKKRRQDTNLLTVANLCSDTESLHSLSRSSSLLQFETLERHCQDVCCSSPSILSFFSQDSLEQSDKIKNVSPDSLERSDFESEFTCYKLLQSEIATTWCDGSVNQRDSQEKYNVFQVTSRSYRTRSKENIETCQNLHETLKTNSDSFGRMCEHNKVKECTAEKSSFLEKFHFATNTKSLKKKEEISSENLSEDSGYSDNLCKYVKNKHSNSLTIIMSDKTNAGSSVFEKFGVTGCKKKDNNCEDDFYNYICYKNSSSNSHFYPRYALSGTRVLREGKAQGKDFRVFEAYDGSACVQPLHSDFGSSCQDLTAFRRYETPRAPAFLNLDPTLECVASANFRRIASASTPSLSVNATNTQDVEFLTSSVPTNLHLISQDLVWCFEDNSVSIAAKNWDLAQLPMDVTTNKWSLAHDDLSTRYRRENSYVRAITAEASDEEHERSYEEPDSFSDVLNLDSAIQKAISDSSVKNFDDDKLQFDIIFHSTPNTHRTVKSTPNLSSMVDDHLLKTLAESACLNRSMQNVPRKSLLATDKVVERSGSTTSKGVHFCPVVSEVSWKDDTSSSAEMSSYSVSSSPHETSPEPVLDVERPFRQAASHPELANKPTEYIFIPLNPQKHVTNTTTLPPTPPPRSSKPTLLPSSRSTRPNSPPPPRPTSHLLTDTHVTTLQHNTLLQTPPLPVNTMASDSKQQKSKRPRAAKLGGFLSRFANFRFSGRKNDGHKNNNKNKQPVIAPLVTSDIQAVSSAEDYIYIPLKGPIPERKPGNAPKNLDLKCANTEDFAPTSVEQVPNAIATPAGGCAVDESNNVLSGKPPLPGRACARTSRVDESVAARVIDCEQRHAGGSMEPMGLIETDLDTQVTVITTNPTTHVKTRSLMNLGGVSPPTDVRALPLGTPADPTNDRPHKSMEFLLDKQNLKSVEPPENELQKTTTDRVMSEHQLRVQRSLQKLTIPEWYKQNQVPREGFILKKQRESKWTGTGNATTGTSKTPSLSSLGSGQSPVLLSPTPHTQNFSRWSTSKLNSAASSPCASTRSSFNARTSNGGLSPCSVRSSFSYRQPYLGWRSQERLTRPRTPAERLATTLLSQTNSENPEIQTSIKEVTSAIVHYVSGLKPEQGDQNLVTSESSTRNRTFNSLNLENFTSTASTPNSFEMEKDSRIMSGNWLEQERRSLTLTSTPRIDRETITTSPRLDTSLRSKNYDSQDNSSQRSVSPQSRGSQKLCWLESSFVGTRPLDSPQTPVSLSSETANHSQMISHSNLKLELQKNINNEMVQHVLEMNATRPSPGSTTLEDVLDSLLGLPPSTRAASPSLQEVASASTSPSKLRGRTSEHFRRRSEGSEPSMRPSTLLSNEPPRRVSFHASPPTSADTNSNTVKCRYSRCGKVSVKSSDAGKKYKNCHNCTYIYCSRECRRAHWEKHRMTCLFSRVGALCRQVLAAAKEHHEFLKQLSLLARQGYLSQGNGAVKCFFSSPECAEKFIAGNIKSMGEPAYVRWADLLPSEMGPNLYSDLIRMCKTYNPDTKFVLYVSVCVVSEVPASGAVKWERQLVSRCAKIRLCRSVLGTITAKELDDAKETNVTKSYTNDVFVHKSREISFASIQKQLRQKGVSLKRQFPEVYQKMRAYVDGRNDKFAPVTIYPKDSSTGKSFMCIIMPDVAEPDKLKLKLPTCAD